MSGPCGARGGRREWIESVLDPDDLLDDEGSGRAETLAGAGREDGELARPEIHRLEGDPAVLGGEGDEAGGQRLFAVELVDGRLDLLVELAVLEDEHEELVAAPGKVPRARRIGRRTHHRRALTLAVVALGHDLHVPVSLELLDERLSDGAGQRVTHLH